MNNRTACFLFYLLPCSLLLTFNSCCTKKDCDDAYNIEEVILEGFTLEETDSIIVFSFPKNSGFTTPIDSFFLSAIDDIYSVHPHFYPQRHMNIEHDYIIRFKNFTEYKLHGLTLTEKLCNRCFPGRDDYYYEIAGYFVNGQIESGPEISIEK